MFGYARGHVLRVRWVLFEGCALSLAASSTDLRQAAGWERTLHWWMERWELVSLAPVARVNFAQPLGCCCAFLPLDRRCWISHAQPLTERKGVFSANPTCPPQSSSTKRWWTLRRERRMALWRDSLHLQVLSVHNPNRSVSEFTTTLLQFLVNRRPPSCCRPCVSVSVAPPPPTCPPAPAPTPLPPAASAGVKCRVVVVVFFSRCAVALRCVCVKLFVTCHHLIFGYLQEISVLGCSWHFLQSLFPAGGV